MKMVVLGSGGFCLPTFTQLLQSKHEVLAVITMPLRTSRKGEKAGIPPMRQAASDSRIPMFEPDNINSDEGINLMRRLKPDLLFVCDYGKILSHKIIETAQWGGLNLHGSLLPKYRGAAPINRALLAGEKELGVSVIHITPEVDAGPIINQASYFPELCETAVEIERHLAEMGAPLIIQAIDQIEKGTFRPIPQNMEKASNAPKIKKEEGHIDWSQSADRIINQYRALQPWPKVFSEWIKKDFPDSTPTRLILGPFQQMTDASNDNNFLPGTVIAIHKNYFEIQTGKGILAVLELQPAGKKKMTAEVFLRGYPIKIGDLMK
ncbi:MAG: methionyl-tRNA formyltransferase [Planctomycetia bacterium]|nr:methionyl-tRNA formyltransferase [Planctomycetia bacterium]